MSAIAIITRCRSPPLSWCGYCASRNPGALTPTRPSNPAARSSASLRPPPRCRSNTSAIWEPMVKAGLRLVIGSWKIIAILSPRSLAISRSERPAISVPRNASRADERTAPRPRSPMMANAVTDLPQPDSPTRQCVSPPRTSSDTPRTASTTPPKRIRRSRTSNTGSGVTRGPQQIAQSIAQQVDAQHQHEQCHAGYLDHPGREEHVVFGLADHQPPGGQRRRHAKAEER